MKNRKRVWTAIAWSLVLAGIISGCKKEGSESDGDFGSGKVTITNVSYDPTREFYEAYNKMFQETYKKKTGIDVTVIQSHGGSGGQARSVVEGAEADVVTLALAHDIMLVEEAGLIGPGWMDAFDKDSSPYTSTIVFLVRAGNPKKLQDWDDLTRDGVGVISPDPKSSGAACWNFLAAWHYADRQYNGDENQMKAFMAKLYGNVLVMDSGARGSTTTFVENGQGDVLVSWENEAIQTMQEYSGDYEMISPSVSILAQPSVAIVDENAEINDTKRIAHDYLEFLYSDDAQRLMGEFGYRPSNEAVLKEYGDKFDLNMELCTINDFGGWDRAYRKFFMDGGVFDEIYSN